MAKKFILRWRESGRHRQRTFPTRAHRDDFKARLRLRKVDPSAMAFGEFAVKWREDHAKVVKAETTAAEEWAAVERHLLPGLKDKQLGRLAHTDLVAIRGELARKPSRAGQVLKPKTVNNVLGIAKSMLTVAVSWKLLGENPWRDVELLPVPERDFDYWKIEERERFLNFCRSRDPEMAELVTVAVHTGLRRGELKALTVGQLDFVTRQIRVTATHNEKLRRRLDRQKNGRVQSVPMNEVVHRALVSRKMAASDSPVFSRGLFPDFYGRLARRCRDAGVKVLGPHDLRHTFASNLVMQGVPLYTVQKYMRHGSITMTERYAHLAPEYLAGEIERLCVSSSGASRKETQPSEKTAD
jgi:integrase